MSLLGVAGGYATLVALLLIVGFSSAAFHAVGPAMAGTLSGPNLGRGMGIWMLCGELGRTLGPILIVSLIGLWGVAGTVYLIPAGLVASLVLLLRMRRVAGRAFSFYRALPWRSALKRMAPVMVPLSGIVFVRAFTMASLTAFSAHIPERRGREPVAGWRVAFGAGRRGYRGCPHRRMGRATGWGASRCLASP